MPNNKFIEVKNFDELQIEHIWIPLKYKSRDERLLDLVNMINPLSTFQRQSRRESLYHR